MKVAIMQPYLFPYLGYYQLAACVDQFVFYDDVNFIKRGYINHNSILDNGEAMRITLPVVAASQNRKISEHQFEADSHKLITRIEYAYRKAPHFAELFPRIQKVLTAEDRDVTSICRASIVSVMDYLDLPFHHHLSSNMAYDRDAGRSGKLIEICKTLGADTYINNIGGTALYTREQFSPHGIALRFLKMNDVQYLQRKSTERFVPYLSMIDTLMWCDPEQTRELLTQYQLV